MHLFLGTGLATETRGRGARDGPGGAPRATRRPALIGDGTHRQAARRRSRRLDRRAALRLRLAQERRPGRGSAGPRLCARCGRRPRRARLPGDRHGRQRCEGCDGDRDDAGDHDRFSAAAARSVRFPTSSIRNFQDPMSWTFLPSSRAVRCEFSVTGDGVAVDPATGVVSLTSRRSPPASRYGGGGQFRRPGRARPHAPPRHAAGRVDRAPSLSGPAVIGAPIAVEPGVWAGQPAPDLALQWLADGAPIAGATEASLHARRRARTARRSPAG